MPRNCGAYIRMQAQYAGNRRFGMHVQLFSHMHGVEASGAVGLFVRTKVIIPAPDSDDVLVVEEEVILCAGHTKKTTYLPVHLQHKSWYRFAAAEQQRYWKKLCTNHKTNQSTVIITYSESYKHIN